MTGQRPKAYFRNVFLKAELVRNRGTWKGIDDLGIAVAEYIDWFNHRRLHGENELITQPSSRTTFTAQHRGDYRRRVSSEPPLNPARDTGLLLDHEHEPKADPDL